MGPNGSKSAMDEFEGGFLRSAIVGLFLALAVSILFVYFR
jgi:hypothetical protein